MPTTLQIYTHNDSEQLYKGTNMVFLHLEQRFHQEFWIFNVCANIVYLYLWYMRLVQVSGLGPWKLDKQ